MTREERASLVERLGRRVEQVYIGHGELREYPDEDCHEAAAEILALEAGLRDVLADIDHHQPIASGDSTECSDCEVPWPCGFERARALLAGEEGKG